MTTILRVTLIVALILVTATGSFAMDDKMMAEMGNITHQEVVDGVKASFRIISMKERMKEMNMAMPKGVKETHHLMVEFKDLKTGKNLSVGEVRVKLQGPDKSEQTKDLSPMPPMMGMGVGFGADLVMDKKGMYGVMAKFKLQDGKVRTAKFWYEVK